MNRGPQVRDARRRSPQDAAPMLDTKRRRRYLNRTHWMATIRRQRPAVSGRLVILDGYLVHTARSREGVTS